MANEITVYGSDEIKERILTVRNQQVMIDRDLAELYGVETKRLNEQVKRNIERFPANFMFQLNENEKEELVAICDRFAVLKHSSYNPYAFTEQGVAMLSAVLKSETAVKTSIMIMDAFVSMRHFLLSNERIFVELDFLKKHFIETAIHQKESDKKIDELFTLMDKYRIEEKQGIFFQGQIFDAYAKFESFIQAAKNEIILIDAYIDLTVLERFAKKKSGVTVKIYTDAKTRITNLDIQKFNSQYPALSLHFTSAMHDRFLIIDGSVLYHIGASLKDLGKKCFAFEILDSSLIPAVIASL
ncbi:MAG: ORF6N domain-containing protein [Treponemataceae bacterium]|nr:ORF6N domain-containing protein [Treponemataceae bacterium]